MLYTFFDPFSYSKHLYFEGVRDGPSPVDEENCLNTSNRSTGSIDRMMSVFGGGGGEDVGVTITHHHPFPPSDIK